VATQIGVNKDTIYNWETNRTEPEVCLIPHIIDFLGYAPYDPNWSFGQWVRAVRTAFGFSQEQLARRSGLDESTIAKWERENRAGEGSTEDMEHILSGAGSPKWKFRLWIVG
jgi:transcriptional regulator with XRE-family HTH domain